MKEVFADGLQKCQVLDIEELTDDLFTLSLRPPRPLVAQPGQFAMLKSISAVHDPLLGRPMSILQGGEELRFLIRRCGKGTKILTSLRRGDEVLVLGPIGRGWRTPPSGIELTLVAGGVGLAPLLFAATGDVLERRPKLLYGARTRSDLVLLDEADRATTLLLATDDGSEGFNGHVTELLAETLARGKGPFEVWTCGPEPMMRKVASMTRELGIPCQVSIEARMACGRGLCLGCAREDAQGVPMYVCRDGPVFSAKDIYGAAALSSSSEGYNG